MRPFSGSTHPCRQLISQESKLAVAVSLCERSCWRIPAGSSLWTRMSCSIRNYFVGCIVYGTMGCITRLVVALNGESITKL